MFLTLAITKQNLNPRETEVCEILSFKGNDESNPLKIKEALYELKSKR